MQPRGLRETTLRAGTAGSTTTAGGATATPKCSSASTTGQTGTPSSAGAVTSSSRSRSSAARGTPISRSATSAGGSLARPATGVSPNGSESSRAGPMRHTERSALPPGVPGDETTRRRPPSTGATARPDSRRLRAPPPRSSYVLASPTSATHAPTAAGSTTTSTTSSRSPRGAAVGREPAARLLDVQPNEVRPVAAGRSMAAPQGRAAPGGLEGAVARYLRYKMRNRPTTSESKAKLARREGFEPPPFRSVAERSIP